MIASKARIETPYSMRHDPAEIPANGIIAAAAPAPSADPITSDASDHALAVAGTISEETIAMSKIAAVAKALVIIWSAARKYIFGARAPSVENTAPSAVEKRITLERPILSATKSRKSAGNISNREKPSTSPCVAVELWNSDAVKVSS